jgi:hypothetical protein
MINETKQTGVDWLSEKVLHREWELLTQEKKRKILEQAKEMEKEKIEKAYDDAIMKGRQEDGEQYYEQTYGGNK